MPLLASTWGTRLPPENRVVNCPPDECPPITIVLRFGHDAAICMSIESSTAYELMLAGREWLEVLCDWSPCFQPSEVQNSMFDGRLLAVMSSSIRNCGPTRRLVVLFTPAVEAADCALLTAVSQWRFPPWMRITQRTTLECVVVIDWFASYGICSA